MSRNRTDSDSVSVLFMLVQHSHGRRILYRTMNPSSFTGGISVKVYKIYHKMRGGQPTDVARNFANTGKDNLAKTLTPVLSDGTNCHNWG